MLIMMSQPKAFHGHSLPASGHGGKGFLKITSQVPGKNIEINSNY